MCGRVQEAPLQHGGIGGGVACPQTGLRHILGHEIDMERVALGHTAVQHHATGIMLLIGGIEGPVGRLRHHAVGGGIAVVGEEGLAGTVDVGIIQLVGLRIVLPSQEEGAAVVEVGAIGVEIGSMAAAVFDFHPTLLVGCGLYAVESFQDGEHPGGGVEEGGRVVRLFEIKLLIALLILFAHGLEQGEPNLFIAAVGRIGQKFAHHFLCLGQFLAAFHISTCLCYHFFLGTG